MIPGLDDRQQWVVFRFEPGDPPKKPPYQSRFPDRNASATNRKTWASLDEALAAVAAGRGDGVGYALTEHDRVVFIDLDKCRNPETAAIDPWALEVLDKFTGCYCEASVSGTGLHILCLGTLPVGGRRHGKIEMYWRERFMYASGKPLEGRAELIDAPDGALRWLWEKVSSSNGGATSDVEAHAVSVNIDAPISTIIAVNEKIKLAKLNDIELVYTWNLLRGWFKADGSPNWSSYDMSIANRLVRHGFSDDEAGLAIVIFREEKCSTADDKAKPRTRRDYLGKTIGRARAGAAPPTEDDVSREVQSARRKLDKAVEAEKATAQAVEHAVEDVAEQYRNKAQEEVEREAARSSPRDEAFEWISKKIRPKGDLKLVNVVRWGEDPGTVELTFEGRDPINFGPAGFLDSPPLFRRKLLHRTEKMMRVTKSLSKDWEVIVEVMLRHAERSDAGDDELKARLNDLILGQVDASGKELADGETLYEARASRRTHVHAGNVYVFGKTLIRDARNIGIEGTMLWTLLRGLGFRPKPLKTKKSTRNAWEREMG